MEMLYLYICIYIVEVNSQTKYEFYIFFETLQNVSSLCPIQYLMVLLFTKTDFLMLTKIYKNLLHVKIIQVKFLEYHHTHSYRKYLLSILTFLDLFLTSKKQLIRVYTKKKAKYFVILIKNECI